MHTAADERVVDRIACRRAGGESTRPPGRNAGDIPLSRRDMISMTAAAAALGAVELPQAIAQTEPKAAAGGKPWHFDISLAQWSLHRAYFEKKLDPIDFPKTAKREYGIDAIEYVNQFYMKHAGDSAYFKDLRSRCDGEGVQSVLIMCDHAEMLGDPDAGARQKAVDVHKPWLEAAKILGCHSIRVNLNGKGTPEEHAKQAAEGLRALCEAADPMGLNVIVENHGGNSSHGDWLGGVMKAVGHRRVGTLPDFGNFYEYDRYQGVKDMMPWAKGVSAKSYKFDELGEETKINYWWMLKIVRAAGYVGRIGIEYEGEGPEAEGINGTKRLLEEIRGSLR
ncbi:MAG TPA: sugar phosphate isomerase/epimerase family protein [Phycisphaerales bacterium]|nr:sugar phosphate isomerase/epimerase family protein [Phycisphaerales bacterium]